MDHVELDDDSDRRIIQHYLRQSDIFRLLTDDIWRELKSSITIHRYKRGQLLVNQGDPKSCQIIVLTGILKISKMNSEGKEVVLRFLMENEMDTIYDAWCKNVASPYSVKVVMPATVAKIPLRAWASALNKCLNLKERFELEAFRQMLEITHHHTHLHLNGAAPRLSNLMEANFKIFNKVPKKHLSAYLSLDPSSLHRLLKRMRTIKIHLN